MIDVLDGIPRCNETETLVPFWMVQILTEPTGVCFPEFQMVNIGS